MTRARGTLDAQCVRRYIAVCASICFCLNSACPACAHEPATGSTEGCALSTRSQQRAVVGVIDGATLSLDDGTQVRLIGALAPNPLDAAPAPRLPNEHAAGARDGDDDKTRVPSTTSAEGSSRVTGKPSGSWLPAIAARQALQHLVSGGSVTLATARHPRDRYGRVLAQVFVKVAEGGSLWLQGALLAAGHARAYGIADNFACMDALLAAEEPARSSGRGLWANPAYAIRSASHTRTLMRLRETYQIVAGTVRASQRAKSGWIYLNFGSNWRSDFSASIAPGVSHAHPAWAASLLDLKARQVRVRGWIERRNGPSINIEHPSQIEVVGPAMGAHLPPPAVGDH